MKIVVVIGLMICSPLVIIAQEQATEKGKKLTASQLFTAHYTRTYQAAIRYNDYGVAKQALYELLVENSQNDSILYSLSLLYVQSNQFASAVLTAEDIKTINPDHLGALEIAAMSYENLGLKDKALSNFESLYLKTEDYQTLYKMAFLQYDLKKYVESVTNVDILLAKKETDELKVTFAIDETESKEFPIKVSLLNLKGLLARDQGDKENARKLFNEALAIAPELTIIKENLASLNK